MTQSYPILLRRLPIGSSALEEKRRHPRANFNGAVSLHEITRSGVSDTFLVIGVPIIGIGRDISEGGICLNLPTDKPLPQVLKLNFQLNRETALQVHTRLAWQVHALCGLEFIGLDDCFSSHLRSYINGQISPS